MTLSERIARALCKEAHAFKWTGVHPAEAEAITDKEYSRWLGDAEALLKAHEEEEDDSFPHSIGWPPIGEDCLLKPLNNTIVEVKLNQWPTEEKK